jgi:hypothetical protein
VRTLDREEVWAALQRGEYEAVATSPHGALDALMFLALELGVFDALAHLKPQRQRAGIPDILLLRILAVLPFLEVAGLSAAGEELFADPAILLQLGFSIQHLQQGFNRRHRGARVADKALPLHAEVLRQELERLDPEGLAAFRRACVGELFARGLVRGGLYALDGSGLGDRFQVVGLLNASREQPLWINWRVLPGDASEKEAEAAVVREMVEEVEELGGPGTIEWLRMDALYADGPLLAWLEHGRGIHALVREPEDRLLYQDLEGLVRGGLVAWDEHRETRWVGGHQEQRRVGVASSSDLTSWEGYMEAARSLGAQQPVLWGALIRSEPLQPPGDVHTGGLVSTVPFPNAWAGYTFWRQRWRIENNGFREIKEGWSLERAPWSWHHERVVEGRVTLTLVAYNVAQVAKTQQGAHLQGRGIRRMRRALGREYGTAPVVVFTEDHFAVFHIEELLTLLGHPPRHALWHPPPALS